MSSIPPAEKPARGTYTLRRVNEDSSWLVSTPAARFVVDPWLGGEEVDIAPWFHRQTLRTRAAPVESLPACDFAVVSHPFSDHCHEGTLRSLPASLPVVAPPAAARRIRALGHFATVRSLKRHARLVIAGVTLAHLPSAPWDPTHGMLLVSDGASGRRLVYAPHGRGALDRRSRAAIGEGPVAALLTTFRRYELPLWLGGPLNLGPQRACSLARALDAAAVVRTHEGEGDAAGLVTRVARVAPAVDPAPLLSAAGARARLVDAPFGVDVTV